MDERIQTGIHVVRTVAAIFHICVWKEILNLDRPLKVVQTGC
jgi:hypothetical protein